MPIRKHKMIGSSPNSMELSKVANKRELIAQNRPVPPPRPSKSSAPEITEGEYELVVPVNRGTLVSTVANTPPPIPAKMRELRSTRDETPQPPRPPGLSAAASMRLQPQQRQQMPRPATIYSNSGVDLKKGVLDALRCPTCRQFMVPPIFMCSSGHSICDACKAKLRDACPSCSQNIGCTRNLALERLAESSSSLYPCRHWTHGCKQQLRPTQLRSHEAGCSFRLLLCPLACGWHGRRGHLLNHARYAHPDRYSAVEDTGVHHVQWDLPLKASFNDYRHAIFAFGESFAYVKHFSEEKRRLYLAVQLFGDPADTRSFRYKFEMAKDTRGCHESMSRTRSVHSCDEDIDTVLQSNACITIDFDTLVYFGNGPRTFKIFKVQQKDDSRSKTIII